MQLVGQPLKGGIGGEPLLGIFFFLIIMFCGEGFFFLQDAEGNIHQSANLVLNFYTRLSLGLSACL